ncbi:hypothetical protein [Chitinophaga japonensis]|uniref:Lipocalin-like protein n=1 Tax=Chitinophaga japonensis TaxID=104662 RepID=A0A562T6A9_CHIJA|nr:hypothetical protein [Chitinophaga japonensis]TWI88616.1 hypothetical protein LX66_2702 [Chitinophaga japonensis]
MKITRALTFLAGIALFAACSKDDDQPPTDVAISGKWNMVAQYRTYTDNGTKDTVHYAVDVNYWIFEPNEGKIFQMKNAQPDTVFYKLIDGNTKVVTAVDDEFIFQADTLSILSLENNQMKLEGNYTTPYQFKVIYQFGK